MRKFEYCVGVFHHCSKTPIRPYYYINTTHIKSQHQNQPAPHSACICSSSAATPSLSPGSMHKHCRITAAQPSSQSSGISSSSFRPLSCLLPEQLFSTKEHCYIRNCGFFKVHLNTSNSSFLNIRTHPCNILYQFQDPKFHKNRIFCVFKSILHGKFRQHLLTRCCPTFYC